MITDQDWIDLMRFTAKELVDIAMKQHPNVNVNDNHTLCNIVLEHLKKFDMNEVIKTEVQVILNCR